MEEIKRFKDEGMSKFYCLECGYQVKRRLSNLRRRKTVAIFCSRKHMRSYQDRIGVNIREASV